MKRQSILLLVFLLFISCLSTRQQTQTKVNRRLVDDSQQNNNELSLHKKRELLMMTDENDNQNDDEPCGMFEFYNHHECEKCPSPGILYGLGLCIIMTSVILITLSLVICPGFTFLAFDFFQFLALLWLIDSSSSGQRLEWTPIADLILRYVTAIFALDWNLLLPLECIFSLSTQLTRLLIVVLPTALVILPPDIIWLLTYIGCIQNGEKIVEILEGWVATAFTLGFQTLMVTTLEAIRCDGISTMWFCESSSRAQAESIVILLVMTYATFWLVSFFVWKQHESAAVTKAFSHCRRRWPLLFLVQRLGGIGLVYGLSSSRKVLLFSLLLTLVFVNIFLDIRFKPAHDGPNHPLPVLQRIAQILFYVGRISFLIVGFWGNVIRIRAIFELPILIPCFCLSIIVVCSQQCRRNEDEFTRSNDDDFDDPEEDFCSEIEMLDAISVRGLATTEGSREI